MCDDHSGTLIEIPTATSRGPFGRLRGIDACIAPLVEALNAAGFATVASCCGHGNRPGTIALADGRELLIVPDYETGRRLDELMPVVYAVPRDGTPRGAAMQVEAEEQRQRAEKAEAALRETQRAVLDAREAAADAQEEAAVLRSMLDERGRV